MRRVAISQGRHRQLCEKSGRFRRKRQPSFDTPLLKELRWWCQMFRMGLDTPVNDIMVDTSTVFLRDPWKISWRLFVPQVFFSNVHMEESRPGLAETRQNVLPLVMQLFIYWTLHCIMGDCASRNYPLSLSAQKQRNMKTRRQATPIFDFLLPRIQNISTFTYHLL